MTRKTTERPKQARSYTLGKREEGVDKRRAEIIAAARKLILSQRALAGFTVDAVAKQAKVTRATVYNQFGSKTGLLGAMFDDLAGRGQLTRLASAFEQSSPYDALDNFIRIFVTFWATDRLLTRRSNALATLDAGLGRTLDVRQAGRKQGLRVILERVFGGNGHLEATAFEQTLETLYTLTSFATFDSLANTLSTEAVMHLVQQLSRAALEEITETKTSSFADKAGSRPKV